MTLTKARRNSKRKMPEANGPEAPCAVRRPPRAAAPVVFESPHSGGAYPPDFGAAVPLGLLRGCEDRFVDELFAEAPRHGATLIAARFPRTYIDPNRGVSDLDPDLLDSPWPGAVAPSRYTECGAGLIFRSLGPGIPIYDRRLSAQEVRHRIERYWRPYHDTLQAVLDETRFDHGSVWHVSCHSMTPLGSALAADPGKIRPDFVLGDLEGRSCAPEFTGMVAARLRRLGYSVAVNEPFKGAELLQRHGDPAAGRHSLQIEINRSLYMDAKLRRHAGFARLQANLGRLAAALCRYARALAP